jgi:flagellar basal body-associated protein FliL
MTSPSKEHSVDSSQISSPCCLMVLVYNTVNTANKPQRKKKTEVMNCYETKTENFKKNILEGETGMVQKLTFPKYEIKDKAALNRLTFLSPCVRRRISVSCKTHTNIFRQEGKIIRIPKHRHKEHSRRGI